MAWDLTDYPNSFKNFDSLTKKKAIEIGNALISEGYPEERAIPISISRARLWVSDASDEEKREFEQQANPTKAEHHKKVNARLLTNEVLVYYKEQHWYVKTKEAKKPVASYKTKEEAIEKAKKMAHNKESKVVVYNKNELLSQLGVNRG